MGNKNIMGNKDLSHAASQMARKKWKSMSAEEKKAHMDKMTSAATVARTKNKT